MAKALQEAWPFGKSSEKDRDARFEQAGNGLVKTCYGRGRGRDEAPIDEGQDERHRMIPLPRAASTSVVRMRQPREGRELDPGTCALTCGGDLRGVGEDVSELHGHDAAR